MLSKIFENIKHNSFDGNALSNNDAPDFNDLKFVEKAYLGSVCHMLLMPNTNYIFSYNRRNTKVLLTPGDYLTEYAFKSLVDLNVLIISELNHFNNDIHNSVVPNYKELIYEVNLQKMRGQPLTVQLQVQKYQREL